LTCTGLTAEDIKKIEDFYDESKPQEKQAETSEKNIEEKVEEEDKKPNFKTEEIEKREIKNSLNNTGYKTRSQRIEENAKLFRVKD
jgi:hypothetical protein